MNYLKLSGGETVQVPIYQPENFGKAMSIDEKQIGEEMHTKERRFPEIRKVYDHCCEYRD